jgi:predicted transcriptional regulator
MTLELRLVKDGKTLVSIPIHSPAEKAKSGMPALDKDDLERLTQLYSFAANERRLRVMSELARRGEMRFSDLLQVALNPKIVQDCMEPMMNEGYVLHEGKGYRTSEKGFAMLMTMTTGFSKILQLLEEGVGGDDEGE